MFLVVIQDKRAIVGFSKFLCEAGFEPLRVVSLEGHEPRCPTREGTDENVCLWQTPVLQDDPWPTPRPVVDHGHEYNDVSNRGLWLWLGSRPLPEFFELGAEGPTRESMIPLIFWYAKLVFQPMVKLYLSQLTG